MFGGLVIGCLMGTACAVSPNETVVVRPEPVAEERMEPSQPVVDPCAEGRERFTLPTSVDRLDPRWEANHLVVVRKAARRVLLFASGEQVGCWSAGLGFAPEGHKTREGDGRTPEGWYRTSDKPTSRYYHAIAVHYPNLVDATRGVADGRIDADTQRQIESALASDRKPPQGTALGGEILLHGGGSGSDWTLGCVALDNADIDALRDALPKDLRADVLVLP